ncbi:MAG TPA: Calx-beta domain-containing protein, partial [Vicinamibacterales bacterium]|nr:Calx-beta domain-containing protein [Vicinamibacterales bacterium]
VKSVQSVTPSTTLLTSSANPSAFGQGVTFTATVTTSSGAFATDGTVTFKEGATVLAGPTAVGSGRVSFTTSALSLGLHTITASYTAGSALGTNSSASVSQHVVVTASIADVSVVEGNEGSTTPAVFTVSLSQASPETVTMNYATADGTATVAGFDYSAASGALTFAPGQTSKTITVTVIGDNKPEFNETFFVNLSNVTNAIATSSHATGTIVNDDAGTIVDQAAVVQSITKGANRLKAIQNPDGGWPFKVGSLVCGGAFGTCTNTIGTTALGLLATYARTGDAASLTGARAAGDLLVSRYNVAIAQTPQGLPFSQDVEFLMWLAQVTGSTTYSSTATAWFQIAVNRFPNAADRINDLLTKRNAQGLRSNVAWDAASYIRAAKAAGNAQYALDTANAIVALEPQWKDTNPAHRFDQCGNPNVGCGPADNRFAFDYTLLGEGSLLWAVHDLPGFASKVGEYSAFLFAQQDPGGSWDVGDSQITAYIVMGLAAIGGQASDNAITLAGGFFIDNQFANGGWPASVGAFANPGEFGALDGEAVRAMNSLFNTAAGNGMSIAPAQLARITFSDVTSPGQTTVVVLDPSSVPPPDARFAIINDLAYQVSTTATTSGEVVVCFSVPWVTDPSGFAALRLLHLEGSALVDRTILAPDPSAPDFATRRLCGRVEALGPFVVARFRPDTTAPTATLTLTPSVLWPPNGRMVTITATIVVADDVDPSPTVALTAITSNEPLRSRDIAGAVIGTDDRSFQLRAERSENREGRVYTIVYRVTDQSGNYRDVSAQVLVPHRRHTITRRGK